MKTIKKRVSIIIALILALSAFSVTASAKVSDEICAVSGEAEDTFIGYVKEQFAAYNITDSDINIEVFKVLYNDMCLVRFTVNGFGYTTDMVTERIGRYVYDTGRPTAQIFNGKQLFEISEAYKNGVIDDRALDEIAEALPRNFTLYSVTEPVTTEPDKLAQIRSQIESYLCNHWFEDEDWFVSKYTEESYAAYATAYHEMNKLYNSSDATYEQLKDAYDKVVERYNSLVYVVSDDELRANLKSRVEEIERSMPVGGTPYTTESYSRFIKAMENARKVAEDSTSSRRDITYASNMLESAYKGLERSTAKRDKLWAAMEALKNALETNKNAPNYNELKELYNDAMPVYYYEPEQSVIDGYESMIYDALNRSTAPTGYTPPVTHPATTEPSTTQPISDTNAATEPPSTLPPTTQAPTWFCDSSNSKTVIDGVRDAVYTGKPITQKIKVIVAVNDFKGTEVLGSENYTVTYKNNVNVGKATVVIKPTEGACGIYRTLTATFNITKADNPISVKASTKNVSAKAVKKKVVSVAPFTVKNAQGKLSYSLVSGSGRLKLDTKTGRLTVRKGTKRGSYTAKVKLTAKGNKNYNAYSKMFKVTVKVK